ncbi:hypothetical protein F53441_3845 [Fusarium austroafricanum]|uniref:Zn(2)-C6 fungal-type domain-containing protein n=1 Tax=Fusarium austroafricanum TaxID=2364996 RepID=A0A8H4KPT8_9HYPO|nr:hypothetical protein F53441_3845 [Fusarium austroafricanum]
MKHLTGVFRATDTHKVTRNRKPVSCTICQKRKSKCDRAKPSCGTCHKRGDPEACAYGDAGAFSDKQDMQLKVSKLEEIVMRLAKASEASHARTSIEVRMDMNEPPTQEVEEGSDAAYHGETSWEAVFKSIHDIQNVLNTHNEPDHQDDSGISTPTPDIAIGGISPITIEEILGSMPSRQDADVLVNAYFDSKFLAVPFIHEHHFWRRYELFWTCPQNPNFLWLSIMFSVLGLGAMIPKPQYPHTVQEPGFYIQRSAQCLVTGEYLKARPYSVEALTLYARAVNAQKKDSEATIWSVYALAVRLAQRRGYHLDAARISPNIKPFEAEMRRRTWFTVQTSDLLFSYQLGMPPMVYQEVCDAGHPRNLSDDDFDEDTDVPESRPPTEPTPMLAWQIKSQLCRLLRRVLRHALRVESPSYEETMALQTELETFHSSVAECFRVRPIATTPYDVPGHTIMHRLIIEVAYLKTICVLHRPYLSADKNQERYRGSRELCRAAALRIIELHLEFEHEAQKGGRMYNDRFLLSSLTLHDFLVAAMILCLDIHESTDITSQDRIQRTQILEHTCKTWEARADHSKDARNGAKIIRAILNRSNIPVNAMAGIGPPAMVNTTFSYSEPTSGSGISGFLMPDLDYSGDCGEFFPLNSFFGHADGFDWASFDANLSSSTLQYPLTTETSVGQA